MSFPTHARVSRSLSIEQIVAAAPDGTVPLFVVTGTSGRAGDDLIDTAVFIKNGAVYDCVTDLPVSKSSISALSFQRYIQS
jgi:hypothetical protein